MNTDVVVPRVLRASTAVMGLGMALLFRTGTAVGSRLFMTDELPHATSVRIEQGLAILSFLAVVALRPRVTRTVAAVVLWLLATLLAWASMDQGGVPFSEWALPAHAMRIAAPLALAWWSLSAPSVARDRAVLWLVRLAVVTVFVVHGIEAVRAHPWFVDLTIAAVARTLGQSLSQSATEQLLLLVGLLDLAAAAALLLGVRVAAWYMVLWGTFTAALRVLAYGSGAAGEAIVRLPHGLLPTLFLGAAATSASHAPASVQPA